MRATWKGALVVGKVQIPIGLYKSADHVDDVSFTTLHEPCGMPIAFGGRRCPTCDVALAGEDAKTVSGFEISEGVFVRVTPADIASVLVGDRVELDRFVTTALLDAPLVDTTYLVGPDKDPAAAHAYDALQRALRKTGLAGLGRIGIGQRERIVAVRTIKVDGAGELIGLSTLYAVDGVRSRDAREIHDRIENLGPLAASKDEVDLFAELLEQRLVGPAFRWRAVKRYYPSKLQELVESKRAGGEITVAPQVSATAPLDLSDALKKSIKRQRARV